jgi:hypothetical protein
MVADQVDEVGMRRKESFSFLSFKEVQAVSLNLRTPYVPAVKRTP